MKDTPVTLNFGRRTCPEWVGWYEAARTKRALKRRQYRCQMVCTGYEWVDAPEACLLLAPAEPPHPRISHRRFLLLPETMA